jgi:hypothetical protein
MLLPLPSSLHARTSRMESHYILFTDKFLVVHRQIIFISQCFRLFRLVGFSFVFNGLLVTQYFIYRFNVSPYLPVDNWLLLRPNCPALGTVLARLSGYGGRRLSLPAISVDLRKWPCDAWDHGWHVPDGALSEYCRLSAVYTPFESSCLGARSP